MENCLLCQIVAKKIPAKIVFEDEDILGVLDINGAILGHTFVIPKKHFTIMEQVPHEIISKIFIISNKISKAMFETINIQGTNLFASNGVAAGQMVAHFMVNVIPRRENDGINLQWEPKKASEQELLSIQAKLKDGAETPLIEEKKPRKTAPAQINHTEIPSQENYLFKQIRRIP